METPRPWRWGRGQAAGLSLLDANGDPVLYACVPDSFDHYWGAELQASPEVRALILRAVNNHDALVAALEGCLVGGNHLASVLLNEVGDDFPSAETPVETAREWFGAKRIGLFDVWCAWSAAMIARAALRAAKGEG